MKSKHKFTKTTQVTHFSPLEVSSLSSSAQLTPNRSVSNLEQQLRATVKRTAEQGNYSVAIALINQLLKINPNNAIDYNNRGLMFFWQGQFLKAIQDYTRALELNNKLAQVYNNRGNCYAALGKWAEALQDYETSLDLNPANLKAWINQGITLRELGMYDLALENFDLALVLGNKFAGRIYAERGYTYHLRGDWNCAIADYRRALSLLSLTNKLNLYRQKVEVWLENLLNPTQYRNQSC